MSIEKGMANMLIRLKILVIVMKARRNELLHERAKLKTLGISNK